MGAVPVHFAASLRDTLGLRRAVETGTFVGDGARRLAQVFPEVVTIEVMPHLHAKAVTRLKATGVRPLLGDSVDLLPNLRNGPPTFYWLDGHWSGGDTGGVDRQCPVLDELAALEGGDTLDCILIDDARLFLATHPPLERAQWPTIGEVIRGLGRVRPGHHVTVGHDVVVAVPEHARDLADAFVLERPGANWPLARRLARRVLTRMLAWLDSREGPME